MDGIIYEKSISNNDRNFDIFFKYVYKIYSWKSLYITWWKKISVEKEDKIISDNNLKNVRLLSDATILFEFYNIPNNLVLERVELFYQSKMIGSIDINEKINNLENCGDDYFDELGRKVGNKGYLLEKDFFRIMGEEYEKYNITYPNRKFELIIYLRNLDTNEIFKLNRSFSLYFEKKGYEFFILSV